MAPLNTDENMVYAQGLAVFDKPSINSGVMSYEWGHYRPTSQITDTGVVEFNIPGTANSYIDLQCSRLQVKGKIVKEGGGDLTGDDKVGLVNIPLHSLWRQVDISLQQNVISATVGTNYSYKAYLDTILSSSEDTLTYQTTSQLFYKDQAGFMDDTTQTFNSGLLERASFTSNSKVIQLEGGIFLDLAQQSRFIPNGVEISLRLWPNKAPFTLMSDNSDEKYEFKVTGAVFKVCHVNVSPAILVGHAAALKNSPMYFPFNQSDIKCFAVAKGLYEFSADNIFQGNVPSSICVGVVSSKAFIGSYNKNPFNFEHFDCNQIALYVDGHSVPSLPLAPDYKNNAYADAYLSVFGYMNEDSSTAISYREYKDGYCLYKFRIAEPVRDSYMPIPKRAHTRLYMKFSEALPESVTVIVYASFPRVMKIDESRNVTFEDIYR
jgi:ribonucleoside-diphosphate reductase beta chain